MLSASTCVKMADLWSTVYDSFWSEAFWLPENMTWNDMYAYVRPGVAIPQVSDMLYPVYWCFAVCIIRIIFEK